MKGDESPTVGISTFTHGDGTCSSLSNYVTESVVDSLFNAGSSQLDIIERSQLSAIFREMELVFDGTIAPDAAKRLGEIEGVDAVVTGTLIQFGEVVKVQARLISTETGRLFATARSEFPSVGSVANMMAERSRKQCGFSGLETGAGVTEKTAPAVVPGSVAQNSSVSFKNKFFTVVPSSVRLWDGEVGVSITLEIMNITDKQYLIAGHGRVDPYATTKQGDTFRIRVEGLGDGGFYDYDYFALQPGARITAVYKISKTNEKEILGSILSLRGGIQLKTTAGQKYGEEFNFNLDSIAIR